MSFTYKRLMQSLKPVNFAKITVILVLSFTLTTTVRAQTPNFPERMSIVERPFSDGIP